MIFTPREAAVIHSWHTHANSEGMHSGGPSVKTPAEQALIARLLNTAVDVDIQDNELDLICEWMLKTTRSKSGAATNLLPSETSVYEKIRVVRNISTGMDFATGLINYKKINDQKRQKKACDQKRKLALIFIGAGLICTCAVLEFLLFNPIHRKPVPATPAPIIASPERYTIDCSAKKIPSDSIELTCTVRHDVTPPIGRIVRIELITKSNTFTGEVYQFILQGSPTRYSIKLKPDRQSMISDYEYTIVDNTNKKIAQGKNKIVLLDR